MQKRTASAEDPYRYSSSGVPGILLYGIPVHRCPRCGAETAVFPRIAQLHRVMARELAGKAGPLTGDEVRFLRKGAGLSASRFAALLGVTPEHLSRVENGHYASLGPAADRLARAIALLALDREDAREILLRTAAERGTDTRGRPPAFELGRGRWRTAPRAVARTRAAVE